MLFRSERLRVGAASGLRLQLRLLDSGAADAPAAQESAQDVPQQGLLFAGSV